MTGWAWLSTMKMHVKGENSFCSCLTSADFLSAGQTQWERPTGGGLNQPFVPSATFSGAQGGYHFTMGHKGLGYYKDEPKTGASLPPSTRRKFATELLVLYMKHLPGL